MGRGEVDCLVFSWTRPRILGQLGRRGSQFHSPTRVFHFPGYRACCPHVFRDTLQVLMQYGVLRSRHIFIFELTKLIPILHLNT
jgi:hypothetical protein